MTPNGSDRRRHARQPVRLAVTAVVQAGIKRIDAVIVDISASGARLLLNNPSELTDSFYMLIPDHRLQPCKVVWRDGSHAGVAYTG